MKTPATPAPAPAATGRSDRTAEWFVPRFGSARFRAAVGMLFLPYTGMVLAFTVFGAALASRIDWERVLALLAVYALALGVAAHALDALGSRGGKPWGHVLGRPTLIALAAVGLVLAYAIGIWYMQRYVPWLWPIALAEGFFLLAYNLEWFGGRFHTDGWFAFSWGGLPALAGYVMQTNTVSLAAVVLATGTAALALAEIKASRPYKALRARAEPKPDAMLALEGVLKYLSGGVVLISVAVALARLLP